jgi:DNA-binding transcriptional LysR family regulator
MGHPLLDDLPSLLCFARVVELGSFTKAAAALQVSKSVVSDRISELEARLGEQLLLRTTRNVTLTSAGANIYGYAKEIAAAGSAATSAASSSAGRSIRVGAPVSLAQMHLAGPLREFLSRNQGAQVELLLNDRLVDLVEERIDLAIRVTKLADSGLIARKLAEAPIDICGSPAYFRQHGQPTRPEHLLQHNCLRYSLIRPDHEWRLYERGERFPLNVEGNFQTTNGTMLREAAIAGLGLAILPRFMTHDALDEGRLVTVLADFAPKPIGIYAVRRGGRHAPPLVTALVRALENALRGPPWRSQRGP